MRKAYRVLAYTISALVVLQAAVMVLAVAGLEQYIDDGNVVDKALVESEDLAFPEAIGFMIHGMNGMMLIPLVALIFLGISFGAKFHGAIKWAGITLLLVVLQVFLGLAGHEVAGIGFLHGMNALLLFASALHAARLAGVQHEVQANLDTMTSA